MPTIFNLRNDPPNGAASATTESEASASDAPTHSSAAVGAVAADESYPEIKGRVESKLMSMWHNVKYGWSGQLRPNNFSKEQPVWLLGRCYHPKFSPTSSMESSAEMTADMENRLSLSDYPPLPQTPQPTHLQNPIQPNNQPHHQRSHSAQQPIPAHPNWGHAAIEEHAESAEFATSADDDDIEVAAELDIGSSATDSASSSRWEEGIDGFRRDFCTRLWMTYRREFPTLSGGGSNGLTSYTSDCGWGCMLRSGQMLLAQALLCHFLGRSWRWDPESQLHATHEDRMHRRIVRWFGDTPSRNSPFSLHQLVQLSAAAGKRPGDWYGPGAVAHLLRKAVQQAAQEQADFDGLHVYVAQDCTVYIQDILDECLVPDPVVMAQRERTGRGKVMPWQQHGQENPAAQSEADSAPLGQSLVWKALVLLVPLRLGTEKLNAIYGNCLKTLLSTEHCIGIIGGRPKHSLYFVGFQEDKLIHLDPHYCQDMVDVNADNFSPATFHCRSPRKLKLSKLDPSCCIGFYCATRADFERFVATVQTYLLPVRVSPTPQLMSASLNGCLPSSSSASAAAAAASMSASTSGRQPADLSAYPMFVFSRARSSDQQVAEPLGRAQPYRVDGEGGSLPVSPGDEAMAGMPDDGDGDETEEFVML